MTGGWNPLTGRDAAPASSGTGAARPPFAPYGAPMPAQGEPYIFHSGGPGFNLPGIVPPYNQWANMAYGFYHLGGGAVAAPPGVYPAQGMYGGAQPMPPPPPFLPFPPQPNGAGSMQPRQAQPWPRIDPAMPASQMTNSTGGVGCEPGYNYFFPAAHTKAHVFKSATPPWQLPGNTQIPFMATHIPCNTTFADLMQGFGCTNPSAKKNRVFEIVGGGGGKWYKGMEINGGDKGAMKKTIGEVGWDSSRTGRAGEKPVVCLWFCKD